MKIIIDTSYLVYYTGFAAWTWYENEFDTSTIPDDGSFDPMADDEFKAMYERRFMQRVIEAIRNKVMFFKRKDLDISFCLDCHRNMIWRNDVFPEYKINRRKPDPNKVPKFSWKGIFTHSFDIMLPGFNDTYGWKTYRHDHCEGDDVIGILVNYLAKQGMSRDEILLVCSDNDLVQLADRCQIVTLKGEDKSVQGVLSKYKWKAEDITTWDVEKYLLHKVIMGDGGDDIPAIKPRVGAKTALDIVNDKERFSTMLEDENINKAFERNKTLIDLQYIPKMIVEDVENLFKTAAIKQSEGFTNL